MIQHKDNNSESIHCMTLWLESYQVLLSQNTGHVQTWEAPYPSLCGDYRKDKRNLGFTCDASRYLLPDGFPEYVRLTEFARKNNKGRVNATRSDINPNIMTKVLPSVDLLNAFPPWHDDRNPTLVSKGKESQLWHTWYQRVVNHACQQPPSHQWKTFQSQTSSNKLT